MEHAKTISPSFTALLGKKQCRPLRRDEEAPLASKVRAGDVGARNRLVLANLRFVYSVAKGFTHRGIELDDLIGIGIVGLIEAANRFDERRNFRFVSYAVWWIRQSIVKALAEQSREWNVPLGRYNQLSTFAATACRLEQNLGATPEIDDIAEAMGLKPADLAETLAMTSSAMFLDAPIGSDDGNETMADRVGDIYEQTDLMVMGHETLDKINQLLKELSPKERDCIRQYYGVQWGPASTLAAIGKRWGVTGERARQVQMQALKTLRAHSLNL